MSEQNRFDFQWLVWLVLAVLTAVIAVALIVTKKGRVRFTTDSNGAPALVGVSFGNTNVRDAVFQGMAAAGIKASIEQPNSFTNMTQASNFVETLNSMSRAGLFSTNRPTKPNPYE